VEFRGSDGPLEPVADSPGVFDLCGRCAKGNRGAGCFCFLRPKRNTLEELALCWEWIVWSAEPLSDLDDSDRRFTGRASAEFWSSDATEATEAPDNGEALEGSSKVTVCLVGVESAGWSTVLFSFFPPDQTLSRGPGSCWCLGMSLDRRIRKGFRTPDFLLVTLPSDLIVGAVVMMAGAIVSLCQRGTCLPASRKQVWYHTFGHRRRFLGLLLLFPSGR